MRLSRSCPRSIRIHSSVAFAWIWTDSNSLEVAFESVQTIRYCFLYLLMILHCCPRLVVFTFCRCLRTWHMGVSCIFYTGIMCTPLLPKSVSQCVVQRIFRWRQRLVAQRGQRGEGPKREGRYLFSRFPIFSVICFFKREKSMHKFHGWLPRARHPCCFKQQTKTSLYP